MSLSDVQQWLNDHDQPSRLDEETCAAAAADGRLDVLRVLRAQVPPCPYDTCACTAAAFHGHLEVLQWLRAQMPDCSWDTSTLDAAASQGHLQVVAWLLKQAPPRPRNLCFERLPLDILKYIVSQASLKDCPHMTLPAACSAFRRKDVELARWITSLDPEFTSCIVMALFHLGWTYAISFMHSIGCLGAGQDTVHHALMWPAMMGDLASIKLLKDVLIAEGNILPLVCSACEGRTATILPHQNSRSKAQLRYWRSRSGRPDFLATAEWPMGLLEAGPQAIHDLGDPGLAEGALLLVEMQANRSESNPTVFWPAATHSFAAAHAAPSVLRWLLQQQAPAQAYTTVHPDCSSARMLLVHGHGWQLPAVLADRLEAAEERRLAPHFAAKRLHQKAGSTAGLGHLPHELIKKIACEADIDFSWSFADSQHS